MSFLKITCRRPGFWRAGVAHDAVKVWPVEAFSADAWKRLRAEPLLTVIEVTDAEAIAHADLQTQTVAGVPVAAIEDGRAGTVAGVLRLLGTGEAQLEAMTSATLDALATGQAPEAFRAIAAELFRDTEGRSGTAREAPSADSGPEGEASAEPEGGALPAAPQNTEGAAPADAVAPGGGEDDTSMPPPDAESGEGAEGKAQSPSEPAPQSAPKTTRKAKAH